MKSVHYAWIVLGITFLTLMLVQGIRLSFGAFIEPWEISFQASRSQITAVSLISYLIFGVVQPFIGRLVDLVGMKKIVLVSVVLVGMALVLTTVATESWQIMLLYGVIASIGFGGTSNVVGTIVVAKWFTHKKGIAMGIMSAGTATGQFSIVPISIMLIELFQWKLALIILASILLAILLPLLALLFRPTPEEKGLAPLGGFIEAENEKDLEPATDKPLRQLFFYSPFLMLFFSFFVCGFTTTGLIDTHLVPFAQFCGFSPAFAGTAVSVLALFNFTFTIISGYFSDRWDCRYMLGYIYGIRGLTIILLLIIVSDQSLLFTFINQSYLLILFSISFGIVDFATIAPTMKLASEYAKKGTLGLMIGLLFFGHQIGAALGSFVPGVLFDLYGNYTITFYLAIMLCALASVASFLLPRILKLDMHKSQSHSLNS